MNLINLREAPIVDKAKEGATLFALNTDGTVERISAENVGGGGRVAIIKADLSSMMDPPSESMMARLTGKSVVADAGVDTLAASDPAEIPCTCDNMTFEEAKAILLARGKLDAVIMAELYGQVVSGYAIGAMYAPVEDAVPKAAEPAQPEKIGLVSNVLPGNDTVVTVWTADGIVVQLG